ncbi:MAG: response regulator [Gemmataceae bacterium]
MLRILVIDDEPINRTMLTRLLTDQGHEVVSEPSGRAALEILRREPVDLVITDILMPEVDGLEIVRTLRKEQPHLAVIAISAGSNWLLADNVLNLARLLGAHAQLSKPFNDRQLHDAITRALALSRASAGVYPVADPR